MIARHLETIFCDDIRHELGNKLSFMGVYSGGLFVPAFPAMLPKLCLSTRIVTPADEPLRDLTLRVTKDEETLHELNINYEQLLAASNPIEELAEEERKQRVLMAQFVLVFSPIKFDGPCILRVRASTEDGEIRGIGLRVEQAQLSNDLSPNQRDQ